MEGSVANQGGQQSAGGEGESQQGQAVTSEQFQQMSGALEEMRGILQAQPWQQQEAVGADDVETPDEPALDLSFLDAEQGYDTQNIADGLQQAIQQAAQAQVEQRLTPLQNDLVELRRERAAEAFIAEFPEMNDEKSARELIELSTKMAQQVGQPELANSPDFWRIVHLAHGGMRAAQAESQASPAGHLEGAGGAGPGGGEQVDIGQLIVDAGGKGHGVLPF